MVQGTFLSTYLSEELSMLLHAASLTYVTVLLLLNHAESVLERVSK